MRETGQSTTVFQSLVAASKKSKGPLYTRYVNRNAAIPLTWLFWKLGLRPNTVSVLSFLVTHSALACLVVFGATWPACITAYLLLVLGYMIDSCDGQLARVSGQTSKVGEWLDHSLDFLKIININLVLGYVALVQAMELNHALTILFAGTLLNALSQSAHFHMINMKSILLDNNSAQTSSNEVSRSFLGWIRHLMDYGLFMLFVLILPIPYLFGPLYLIYGIFYLLLFSMYLIVTLRSISQAGE